MQMIIFEDGDRNIVEWGRVVHVLVEVTWRAGTLKLGPPWSLEECFVHPVQ